MEIDTGVTSKMVIITVKEPNHGLTETNTRVNGWMGKNMDMDNTFGKMAQFTKENMKMSWDTALEFIFIKVARWKRQNITKARSANDFIIYFSIYSLLFPSHIILLFFQTLFSESYLIQNLLRKARTYWLPPILLQYFTILEDIFNEKQGH